MGESAPAPDPTPIPADSRAPADLEGRTPTRRERAAWYAGAVLLTCVVVAAGFRLDQVGLTRAPFSYDGDVLLIAPMVKATIERGSHWRNERLGYPGIQELHDFPVIDHLHFAIIWLLGRVTPDWVTVYNLYFLLTWPLTTLTAMYAFRRLGLTLPAAAVGGMLYAFLPYHYLRGESHYFLAAYWVVPLSWLPALAVCKGDLPFYRREPDGGYRLALWRQETVWMVLLGAATASAGAYYAFFACAVYALSGVYGWVVTRTWKAAASAGGLTALVVAFGILNHAPTFAYIKENGRNSTAQRFPSEGEAYAMKLAHLVLPVDGHNMTALGRIKSAYTATFPLNNENSCATLGAVGAAGLLGLLAVLLLPTRKGWPFGPLAFLTGFIVLFATTGGLGGVFNLLVFDQVRCYNRFSIYLAFLCLLASMWVVDRFLLTRTGRAAKLRYPAFAGLLILGIADQTPTAWFGEGVVETVEKDAKRFEADREFFQRVEQLMLNGRPNPLDPAGPPKVFMIPYIPYPEVPPVYGMNTYEHARGYLHTNTLVWGPYGAMKNREVDEWYRWIAHRGIRDLVDGIVYRGFDGVFVDIRGFLVGAGNRVVDEIKEVASKGGRLKIRDEVHDDKLQVFIDLRPYRDWLWDLDGGATFSAAAEQERERVTITWLHGFQSFEPYSLEWTFRWGSGSGTAVIVNPGKQTRKFMITTLVGVDAKGAFRITIDGGDLVQLNRADGPGRWFDVFEVRKEGGDGGPPDRKHGEHKAYLIEVPPGRHTVKFKCRPPDKYMPGNAPPLYYYLMRFAMVEMVDKQ